MVGVLGPFCMGQLPFTFYKQSIISWGCIKVRPCLQQVVGICFPSLLIGSLGRCPFLTNTRHIKGPFSFSQGLCTGILWKWRIWKLVCLQDGTYYGLLCLDDSLRRCSFSGGTVQPLRCYLLFLPMGGSGEWIPLLVRGSPIQMPLLLLDISFHFLQASLLFLSVSMSRASYCYILLPETCDSSLQK